MICRIKEIRGKLGLLSWKFLKKYRDWKYFFRKDVQRVKDWVRGWYCHRDWDRNALESAECIVVCAHPDDETLYFYSVLKAYKPFVICMSGAGSRVRSEEFRDALEKQGVKGMLLNMPDVPHMAWAWKCFAPMALKRAVRRCGVVRLVYTHSAVGESHHPHHYASYAAAVKTFAGCRILTTAPDAPGNGDGALPEADVARKHGLLRDCYPSQIKMLETWYPWWDSYLGTEFFEE